MYAFVHIDKTAGSTLITILRRWFGARHCDIRLPLAKRTADGCDHRAFVDAADLRRVRRIYRFLRGISGHNVKPYADLADSFPEIQYFTILRDPSKRFVSHFLNRSKGHDHESFERWVSSPLVHNWQTKMIAGKPSAQKAIDLISARFGFVGLTERFDESLILLGKWLGEPGFPTAYRSVNRLNDKRRRRDAARKQCDLSYLDSEAVRARIRDANVEDQKLYDFVASTIYVHQKSEQGGDLDAAVRELRHRNASHDPLPEPRWGSFKRNCLYKPLLHCRAI